MAPHSTLDGNSHPASSASILETASGTTMLVTASERASSKQPATLPTTYSRIQSLASPTPPPDSELSIFKLAKEIFSSVTSGSDVSNVPLPASVLDPESTLEKTKKSMQRGELLQDMCNPNLDARTRFLNVMRFNLSGLARERFGKKPYNPVLGEVYRCCFVHRGNGGETLLVTEQVSHHPPITALHLRNDTLGFVMNSHTAPEPCFWGNSLVVKLPGAIRICLKKMGNEEYVITRPSIFMSGFFAGKQRLEFDGLSTFICEKTGISAEIEYKAKGAGTLPSLSIRAAEMNAISGRVFETKSNRTLYTLEGHWDRVVTLTDVQRNEQSVFFDYDAVCLEKSMVAILPAEEEEEDLFSTRVWRECSVAIMGGKTAEANKAKRKVEDYQRELRKERQASNVQWTCRYFIKRGGDVEGYQLRPDLNNANLIKVDVSREDLKGLRSGVLVDKMVEDLLAELESEDGVDGNEKRRFFRRRLTSRARNRE